MPHNIWHNKVRSLWKEETLLQDGTTGYDAGVGNQGGPNS